MNNNILQMDIKIGVKSVITNITIYFNNNKINYKLENKIYIALYKQVIQILFTLLYMIYEIKDNLSKLLRNFE